MPKYRLVKTDALSTVAVVIDGNPYVTDDISNPRFDEILEYLEDGETPPVQLFDLTEMVSRRFENLSERVSVAGGRVYFDGDEIDSSLTRQISRLVDQEEDNWLPLVLFLENLAQNPEKHSQDQLYDWLSDRDFTLTDDGCFLAYKGVTPVDGGYMSGFAGTATVDGVLYENTKIPNNIGSVVTMPRSNVQHDPETACSVGLHAGTHSYASSYGTVLLTVKINPRDVVSVPRDGSSQKLRVCRYEILEVNEKEYENAVWYVSEPAMTYTTGNGENVTLTVNSQAKLDWNSVDDIREDYKDGASVKQISETYDVSERTIQRIVNNQAWVR